MSVIDSWPNSHRRPSKVPTSCENGWSEWDMCSERVSIQTLPASWNESWRQLDSLGLLPSIVHVWRRFSGTCGVRDRRSRFTVSATGAKVQNNKSLKRKKLITHLLKSIVGTTLIYLTCAGRIPVPWVTSCRGKYWLSLGSHSEKRGFKYFLIFGGILQYGIIFFRSNKTLSHYQLHSIRPSRVNGSPIFLGALCQV